MILQPLYILRFTLVILLLSFSGCNTIQLLSQAEPSPAPVVEEKVDSSCSYFYFLWGSHADYNQQYEEALEAFQKASICDPTAEYIAEKIPILLIQVGQLDEAALWLANYIQTRPHKTMQRFMLARLKIQKGEIDEAIILYQDALELEPQNDNIRLRLGLLYSKQKKYKIAENLFKTILETNENSYFSVLYLARLYSRTGELDLAEVFYNRALDLNWSKELSFELAEFYNVRQKFTDALGLYRGIINEDPKDERAALGSVQTLLYLKKHEEALKQLAKVRKISNNPERIDLARSQILINRGNLKEAKDVLISILEKTSLAQANYLLGVIYYEEKNHNDALSVLSDIPATADEFKDSILIRVRILEETERSEQSVKLLRQVVAAEESKSPFFYSLLASIYLKQKQTEDALETYTEAVGLYENDQQLLYDYAILLEKQDRHDLALLNMEKILLLNPNHPDALNFIGYTLADKNIDLAKAYEYITKALELKPKSGYIQDSLGWVFFRMGQFNRAKLELEKAIKMEPEDPYIYDHLGDTYRALNRRDQAILFYRKALEILKEEKKSTLIKEKIKSLDEK